MSNELSKVTNPFGAVTQMGASHATAVAQAREAQEVQAMVFMAKQFPRDERAAMDRILMACTRQSLAKDALYQYSKGGSDVSGPSIRLAEAMAQAWGNLDYGFRTLEATEAGSKLEAYCWDIETNVRTRRTFEVSHMRHTRSGDYLLTDPREIYEMQANQAARRVRACILATIPGDVADAAVEQCRKTQEDEIKRGKPIKERVVEMVKVFEGIGVTRPMLEAYIGRSLDGMTAALLVKLSNVYKSIKDGMASVEDHFAAAMDRVAEKEQKRAKRSAASEILAAPTAAVDGGHDIPEVVTDTKADVAAIPMPM